MFAVRRFFIKNLLHAKTNPLRTKSWIHLFSSQNILVIQSGYTGKWYSLLKCSSVHTLSSSYAASDRREVNKKPSASDESVLMQVFRKKEQPKQLTVGAKVVQASRDFTYLIAIVAGFGIMGFLFYSIGSEFFSSNSPSSIFTQALKRVRADDQIKEILGEPISGHGEESGRGRRKHLNHLEYIADGRNYMRMTFYVTGSKRKGKAHLDLLKNESGKYELRFLFVELIGYPSGTILIVDNR